MPSFKFLYPKNFDTIPPNEAFTIRLGFRNMDIEMTNPETRYLSAPQQLAGDGSIKGYAQVVIEALTSLNQTSFTDPLRVAFAASMNGSTGDGVLVTDASKGLPAGFYRMSSRALTANHAPLAYPLAVRGTVDDVIYFQVGDGGSPGSIAANSIIATAPVAASTSTSIAPSELPEGGGSGSSPMASGAVIGGSIGGVILVVIIAISLLLLRSRRKRRREGSEPAFDTPQRTYPFPFTSNSQMANIVPFLETSKITDGRSKDGRRAVGLESSEAGGSSSRRLSFGSVAPSYHTVAQEG
ncbi:hypothetical protein PM082_008549 [Marasmius tenuissimus]|nr:hypothetical protein PM082_008549 [Marasmius tenuissimus]